MKYLNKQNYLIASHKALFGIYTHKCKINQLDRQNTTFNTCNGPNEKFGRGFSFKHDGRILYYGKMATPFVFFLCVRVWVKLAD